MSNQGFFRKTILFITIAAFGATIGFAQDDKDQPSQDPTKNVRKVGKETDKIFQKWVNQDVEPIITSEERAAFKKLKTDAERENFIEQFWARRDPNPDTEENEYREEYYERIAYANEHYASGIPGWKTDRGRTYIRWGKPDSVESNPTGTNYDRPESEGGGSTTTYAYETWFYRYLEGVGSGIEIEFVDPTGTGEYHIARSPFEKDALLMVPGVGLSTADQLGLDRQINSGSSTGSDLGYVREQDTFFRRQQIITDLQRPPQIKYADLITQIDSGVIDNNPLDFNLRVDFFRQSSEQVVTTFTVQTENKNLVFEDTGGIQTAKMNILGRITAVTGKRSGIFEDAVTASATKEELSDAKDHQSIYQKAYALTPGTYKVDVIVRDVASGNRGIRSIGFTVPRYDDSKLSTSTLVLASTLRSTTESDIGGSFVIGNAKVIPNLGATYKQGQDVGVYMQIYNARIDETTLRPAVDVEYMLMKNGKVLLEQPENWEGLSDAGQRLTIARLLPTGGMTEGDYEIKIKIKDRVSNQTLEPTAKFTIIK